MPGLGPGIHVFFVACDNKDVDGRARPGHDESSRHQRIGQIAEQRFELRSE